jgi:putative transposase
MRTIMPTPHLKPEEIMAKLCLIDVLASQGQCIADAVRQIGVTEAIYNRWRRKFPDGTPDQGMRLKALEQENARLRGAMSDLTSDKIVLVEAAKGNF